MSDTVDLGMVRQLWRLLEPVHAVLYYAPEAFAEAEALGYATDERWPSYFAWRAAPFGDASAELVTSTFYSFRPQMVARYVPDAWDVASADKVLAARTCAVDRALRTVLGDRVESPELAESAELARHAATSANTAGRPLATANAALPWPESPHLVLWQAATVLREHRGDGHIAALLAHQLGPCESLVSFAAVGAAEKEVFASREWNDVEWHDAADRLAERGWLEPDGTATTVGVEGREDVERLTDELAAPPWRELGATRAARLAELVMPVTMAIVGAGILPQRSTLGLGR